jgi:hypothetical protein
MTSSIVFKVVLVCLLHTAIVLGIVCPSLLHHLSQDAQRDLFWTLRAYLQPRGGAHSSKLMWRQSLRLQAAENFLRAFPVRKQRYVSRTGANRLLHSLFIELAPGGDDSVLLSFRPKPL